MQDDSGWRRIVSHYGRRYGLSQQELRVLLSTVEGTEDKRMAAEWGCSRWTVATYWKRIFAKTGMRPQREVLAHLLRFAGSGTNVPLT